MIVRIRADELGFTAARATLRKSIADGLEAWSVDLSLVSISPIPLDRVVRRRKSPTKRERLGLLDIMEGRNA